MARKKKTVEETTEKTILRNYDIYSLENRVHAMDKKIQRSYDIYSLEKRIHDLEMNGGGGGGGTDIVLLQDSVADVSKLDYTITASTHSQNFAPEYAFGKYASTNLMWIANAAVSWLDIASTDEFCLKCIKWLSADSNRYSAPTKVSYSNNGTDYTDTTIMESSNNMCFVADNVKAKHWRLHFSTTDSATYYVGMNDAKMYGYK